MGQVRGAGLRHGYIRLADGSYHDVDAIISLEGALELSTTTVEGDDQELVEFASLPTETLAITANSVSTELLAALTGQDVTAVTTEGKEGEEVGIGTEGHANPPFVEVGGFTVGKLKVDDTPQTIKHIFHRVQLRATTIPQEKDGEFRVEYEGKAYATDVDITGTALASKRTSTLGYTAQSPESIAEEQEEWEPEDEG